MYKICLTVFAALFFAGCKVNKNNNLLKNTKTIQLSEVVVNPAKALIKEPIRLAAERQADLLHTKLMLTFNWQQQLVYGKALLTIKPFWLKNIQSVQLHAQGFIINKIALIQKTDTINLNYIYNNKILQISLNRTFNYTDTFKLYISYTAQPQKITNSAGNAITDSKGLYFINPLLKDPNKPKQIWTQGETQFNSCWFPTIDEPGEKHTQEIEITVDENLTTLSNGELIFSIYNKNGTRTDYWQQLKPHAPYLTMLAVGEFAVVKDFLPNQTEVSYYVEPKYKPYARMIFGETPSMILFFEKITGVDYPWDKYSQVVVRDFVSGAMENTSAVVHFEGVAHNAREHLDYNAEDIIVHELFHHWFGDLVTCKSWNNLPLNESFATYGEYLWNEFKYGKAYADMDFTANIEAYLRAKSKHKTPPIRTAYNNEVDLFDVVSYQKGSCILHLLRNQIGDTAFFNGMRIYLTANKFGTADIHHLRHAFEEASGKDLSLFFNQWFLKGGHPKIKAEFNYANNLITAIVNTKPADSTSENYYLPTTIEYAFVNANNKTEITKHNVLLTQTKDTFYIKTNADPLYFTIDGDGVLPAELVDVKPDMLFLNQLKYAASYVVKKRALRAMVGKSNDSALLADAFIYCLNDTVWQLNLQAINYLPLKKNIIGLFTVKLKHIATNHQIAACRAAAIKSLNGLLAESDTLFLKQIITNDSSYAVVSAALFAMADINIALMQKLAAVFEKEESGYMQYNLAELYLETLTPDKTLFFTKNLGKQGLYRNGFYNNFIDYTCTLPYNDVVLCLQAIKNYLEQSSDDNINKITNTALLKIKKYAETFKNNAQKQALITIINNIEQAN